MDASQEIEVRLLGPFEVLRGGRPIDVPRGRLRVVLATLALSAGQVVGPDVLAERLWHEDMPARPRDGVQNHVRRLRQLLNVNVVRTAPTGYWLDVPDEQVDALRFLKLVDAASRARAAGGGAEAREGLLTASRLWRGEPLEGVDSESLRNDVVAALTERHLTAEEQRIDLDLADGRHHADLIAELRGLVARHPLREPLWTRLLTALHGAGRDAEALETYHAVRTRLAEQLGVDPSPELQRVYKLILTSDAPTAPSTSADHEEPVAGDERAAGLDPLPPRQLPTDVAGFVGRAAELAALDAMLREFLDGDGGRVTIGLIHGPGGVGKTALAVHWAWLAAAHFPDGHLHLDLQGYGPGEPMPVGAALGALLRSLGVQDRTMPVATEERTALLRTTVTGRRLLLLLDNARDADQVRPLLPGANALVLVTSRSQLRGLSVRDGARLLLLRELGGGDAAALVSDTIGAGRVAAETDASAELIELCGRLPLALRIAAELAVRYPDAPLASLVDDLRRQRLEALADPVDPMSDVRAVFSWSYRSLKADDAFVFRRLSLHPGRDISLPAAAPLIGASIADTRRALDRLVAVHLLEQRRLGRYRFHDLLREYAAERTGEEDTAEGRRTAVRRALTWYLHTATVASEVAAPGRQMWAEPPEPLADHGVTFHDQVQALDWYDAEREVLVAAVRQAESVGADDIAWRLASSLSAYFVLRPVWEEWESVHGIALTAARRAGDPIGQGAILAGLGTLRVGIGHDDEALGYYRDALKLFREAGARAQEATVLVLIANAYQFLGLPDQALETHHQSLALAREIGDPAREAHVLTNLALTEGSLGRYEEAAASSRRALEIRHALGDHRGRAPALDNLGDAYVGLGEHARAAACYREAIEIARAHRDQRSEGIFLSHLARAEHGDGQTEQAQRTAEQAWLALADASDAEGRMVRERLRASFPHVCQQEPVTEPATR